MRAQSMRSLNQIPGESSMFKLIIGMLSFFRLHLVQPWRRFPLLFVLTSPPQAHCGPPSISEILSWQPEYRHRVTRRAYPLISVSYTHLRAHETDSYLVC